MQTTLTFKKADAVLDAVFTPNVLISLVVCLAALWWAVPGSYRLVRQGSVGHVTADQLRAEAIVQAESVCAERGQDADLKSSNTLPSNGVWFEVEIHFSCK